MNGAAARACCTRTDACLSPPSTKLQQPLQQAGWGGSCSSLCFQFELFQDVTILENTMEYMNNQKKDTLIN